MHFIVRQMEFYSKIIPNSENKFGSLFLNFLASLKAFDSEIFNSFANSDIVKLVSLNIKLYLKLIIS